MAATDHSIDEQVEDLRERMRLLQGDRRANIDILEANKAANKEEIRRLREDNKDLRVKIGQLQRSGAEETNAAAGGSTHETLHMQGEVMRVRKGYDDARSLANKHRQALAELKDEVRDLELEARRPNQEDSPLTRNIRMLENRLDKAMIKYNEAQSIRKTYEQIVKRLKEERIGFDNQLAALERTYAAKQRDYEELLLLSGDANHAREVAQQELERVRGGYEEERRRRDDDLRARHQVVQLRKQMVERIEKREKMRAEIVAQEAGDLGEEGETNLKKAMAVNMFSQQSVSKERVEQRTKIDIFEAAFRKIKEATGVSDVNEVIQKIISQEGTTENLMVLTKENQAKVEALNEKKTALKARVEEMKYSGPGGGHRRKMVDDHEEQLTSSAARLERCRLKHERLAKVLISVKAGVKHIQDKLEGLREEVNGQRVELTDETVVNVLYENEKVLLELLARVKASKDEDAIVAGVSKAAGFDDDGAASGGVTGALGDLAASGQLVDDEEMMQARPFNQRIDLPLSDEEFEGDGPLKDDGLPDVDEEELTRDKVKKASTQIMLAQDKKKKVKKRHRNATS